MVQPFASENSVVDSPLLQVAPANARLPEWRHDPALEQVIALDAFHGASDDDSASSGVSEDLLPPPPTGPGSTPRRIDARHAIEVANVHRAEVRRQRLAHGHER
jgi:hypothetical protein